MGCLARSPRILRWQHGGRRWAAHVGKVAELVLRAYRRRPFVHLVIVTRDPLRRMIDATLSQTLKRRAERKSLMRTPNTHRQRRIMHVVAPIVEGAERGEGRAALTIREDAPGTDHPRGRPRH